MSRKAVFSVQCPVFSVLIGLFFFTAGLAAEGSDLEFTIDTAGQTLPLPQIFHPAVDLSGQGLSRGNTWPQSLAAKEALEAWQKDIGFGGIYRLQYGLWEIYQLSKDKEAQAELLANYENTIKLVSDAGGIVILDIFGIPKGMGRVLDKKCPPANLRAFKELIKGLIRDLSCAKRYNIWYEVWNAPDLDDFFLGRQQDYLNIYRMVAEAVNELKSEYKIHIPIGGPSTSAWFRGTEENTAATPERSLIYQLIKFCYERRLPLNFISWHGYSSDPLLEKETTIYKRSVTELIRDWLSYFHFERDTALIVDEWNYDSDKNILEERQEKSFIAASYLLSRLKNMQEAGLNYQVYFSLEDFQNDKDGIARNVGLFSFDAESTEYKGQAKAAYNALRMLNGLGSEMFLKKLQDDFVGVIATKGADFFALIFYNYIDPEIALSFLSRNVSALNGAERRTLLNLMASGTLRKIIAGGIDISSLRLSNRLKTLLKKAQELSEKAKASAALERKLTLTLQNLKGSYLYQKYKIDSGCGLNCAYVAAEEKEVKGEDSYQEALSLAPYSAQLIILKNKPQQVEPVASRE